MQIIDICDLGTYLVFRYSSVIITLKFTRLQPTFLYFYLTFFFIKN